MVTHWTAEWSEVSRPVLTLVLKIEFPVTMVVLVVRKPLRAR